MHVNCIRIPKKARTKRFTWKYSAGRTGWLRYYDAISYVCATDENLCNKKLSGSSGNVRFMCKAFASFAVLPFILLLRDTNEDIKKSREASSKCAKKWRNFDLKWKIIEMIFSRNKRTQISPDISTNWQFYYLDRLISAWLVRKFFTLCWSLIADKRKCGLQKIKLSTTCVGESQQYVLITSIYFTHHFVRRSNNWLLRRTSTFRKKDNKCALTKTHFLNGTVLQWRNFARNFVW